MGTIALTAGQAFKALHYYLSGVSDRTKGSYPVGVLVSDTEIHPDRQTLDQAALGDWFEAVTRVLRDDAES